MNRKISFISQFSLNDQQYDAVTHLNGPLLVTAGPGSGKTRIIVGRVLYLILEHQVDPSSIVALTFTNKAALEMKERLNKFLYQYQERPFIGTFHSYCLRLLKKRYTQQNNAPFSILDEEDQEKIIRTILRNNRLTDHITIRRVKTQLALEKQLLPGEVSSYIPSTILSLVLDVCRLYEQQKKASNCMDFDDLLRETLLLFTTDLVFKQSHQSHIRHLLVDEYQDTNKIQHELLKALTLNQNQFVMDSLCAVGDEDQSIYSWRGATISNFLDFKADFQNTHLVKIEQNYRSVQPILSLANHLIQYNLHRNQKLLWSSKEAIDRIRITECSSEYQEADASIECVLAALAHNSAYKIGILYRTHAQSRALEEAFIRQSIPYKLIGGIHFYERKEIKDILAYLKLIINPFDHPSLLRILNIPTRGLGEKCEEIIHQLWQEISHEPFNVILQRCIEQAKLTAKQIASLTQFLIIFEGLDRTNNAKHAIETIITRVNYFSYLRQEYEEADAQERSANIKELIEAAYQSEQHGITTLESFLDEVSLLQEKILAPNSNQNIVSLMTLHAAKGLEFDLVILPGLEEGIMPSSRALFDDNALEEERRLLYVGITRTAEYLLITHVKRRNTYGKSHEQLPSRFLDEIIPHLPSSAITKFFLGNSYLNYFKQWFNKTEPLININPPSSSTIKPKQPLPMTTWHVGQLINHSVYGTGIIRSVEGRIGDTANLSIIFKSGLKKIRSSFVTSIAKE